MKYLIVGTGYRAQFFMRSHLRFPDHELIGVLTRSEEKADEIKKMYGIKCFTSRDEALSYNPDLIVVCVKKTVIHQTSMEYLKLGYRVLQETPAGLSIEDLKECYELGRDRLFIAEQYIFCDTHGARLKALDTYPLGRAHTLFISDVHDYHAASLIRNYLKEGLSDFCIRAMEYSNPIVITDSRYGPVYTGEIKPEDRVHMILEYSDGKRAFYDFSGIQYHSFIRGRHIEVLCEKGEIFDSELTYLDDNNKPVKVNLPVLSDQNDEDEKAIKILMDNMNDIINKGEAKYPLAHALEDAYTMLLMQEAIKNPFKEIKREPMPWH